MLNLCGISIEHDIRFDLIACLCPNTTSAELHSVAMKVIFLAFPIMTFLLTKYLLCAWAGMFAIYTCQKVVAEQNLLDTAKEVMQEGMEFSST